jgi:hypothetical protein
MTAYGVKGASPPCIMKAPLARLAETLALKVLSFLQSCVCS